MPLQPLPNDILGLFPNEFVESELGWIPKGWKHSELSNFISIKHGYAYKGEFFSEEVAEDVLLTPGNVAIGGGFKGDKLKYYNGPTFDDYVFDSGDLYVTMTDLSKAGDTLGFPAFVPEIESVTFHHNQRLGRVEFKDINRIGKEFIYRCLCSREYRCYVVASATGTTVKHTSPTKILQHKIINSGGIIEPIFDQLISKFTDKREFNNRNSAALYKTRSFLLPKLISGDVEVKGVANGTA